VRGVCQYASGSLSASSVGVFAWGPSGLIFSLFSFRRFARSPPLDLTSMARMYSWSPDECVPAFYLDPDVLLSLSKDSGLPDIGTSCNWGGVCVLSVVPCEAMSVC
jgi:hypothetical protein